MWHFLLRWTVSVMSYVGISVMPSFGASVAETAATLRDFKCSGQMNCPTAKVFAWVENACTAQMGRPAIWGPGLHPFLTYFLIGRRISPLTFSLCNVILRRVF